MSNKGNEHGSVFTLNLFKSVGLDFLSDTARCMEIW